MKARDQDGQVLIIALAFLVFFGVVIGAIVSFADANIRSTERLREQRSAVYAADGATDAAIQMSRIDNGIGAYGDARCQAPGTPLIANLSATPVLVTTTSSTSDLTVAKVICTWAPGSPLQPDRTVTFTTFVGSTATPQNSKPVVQATVIYYDSAGTSPPDVTVTWTYCGHDAASCI